MEKVYDIIVVGGGPAGITAAIYAKRANKEVLIIEKFAPGGQVSLIGEIENYPGFSSIDGNELSMKFYNHASGLNIPFAFEEVERYDFSERVRKVICNKNTYSAKTIILALGSQTRHLGIEGEEKFRGKGVSYCALCDGNFFKDKSVAVVGSGDSAFSDAIYLSSLCKSVHVLTKDKLSLHNYAENEFDDKPNVKILRGANSKKILGEDKVTSIEFDIAGKENKLNVDAVFVAIGRVPDTENLKGLVEMNGQGFIIVDSKLHTSCKGVFAAGDIRSDSIRQIATAVGDGALAGTEAVKYCLLFDRNLV